MPGLGPAPFGRPTAAEFAAFDANKDRRRLSWIIRRYKLIGRGMPEPLRRQLTDAVVATGAGNFSTILETLILEAPDQGFEFYRAAFESAAAAMTPAEIQAEAATDKVMAWGLWNTKSRMGIQDSELELKWWWAVLGPIGEGAEKVWTTLRSLPNMAKDLLKTALGIAKEVIKVPFEAAKEALGWEIIVIGIAAVWLLTSRR